ncbi:MAG: hypothetical protein FWF22_08140 [Treponema sp.]|nr:hypothetical protein [Treponema sp.]
MLKRIFFLAAAMLSACLLMAQAFEDTVTAEPEWYLSNASGMALEYVPSRLAALRNEYCISVSKIQARDLPPFLIQYYDDSFSTELRVLYENGEPSRQQWIFRDQKNITRLNASGPVTEDNPASMDFMEIYNENHYLTEESQFLAGSNQTISYTYSGGLLIKTETTIRETQPVAASADNNSIDVTSDDTSPNDVSSNNDSSNNASSNETSPNDVMSNDIPSNDVPTSVTVFTDLYRYTRSASLRTIERTYISGVSGDLFRRIPFPALAPGVTGQPEFQNPGLAYGSLFPDGMDIPANTSVIYSTDSKGRVLSERRLDENGDTQAELVNTWTGDRLDSISWKSADQDKTTEYEYDENGNRIVERNYNNGVLERVVKTDGNRDTEELYMDGKLMLRATYEDGRKISEERIRPSSSNQGQ